MNVEDLKNGKFFTTNGKDIWKLESYCLYPTCTLVNLETGKKESFGLGGLTAQGFLKIEMPIVDDREVLNEVQSEN